MSAEQSKDIANPGPCGRASGKPRMRQRIPPIPSAARPEQMPTVVSTESRMGAEGQKEVGSRGSSTRAAPAVWLEARRRVISAMLANKQPGARRSCGGVEDDLEAEAVSPTPYAAIAEGGR